jgi:hypothetical protein
MSNLLTVEEASDALSKYTQAAIAAKEANDLLIKVQKEANELELRRQVSDRNRLVIAMRTQEMVEGIIAMWPQFQLYLEGFSEWQKEDSRWKDRQDEILLLILTGKGNGNKARVNEFITELTASHTQRLLMQETENLYQLREQASTYGMGVPLSKLNEIKQAERTIEKLQIKLDELNK